jgi:hypothetical protein
MAEYDPLNDDTPEGTSPTASPGGSTDPFDPDFDPGDGQAPAKSQRAPTPRAPAPVDTTDYGAMPWSEVGEKAISNIVPSAKRAGSDLLTAVTHPIDTASNLGTLGKGLVSKVAGGLGMPQDPQEKANTEAVANAFLQHYEDYLSGPGLKKAIATDPFGTALDASAILGIPGSAVGRLPGVVGQAGRAAATLGSAIDPVQNAMRLVSMGAKPVTGLAKMVVPAAQSVATGAPMSAFKLAAEAGATADPVLKNAFVSGMRMSGDPSALVDAVNGGIRKLENQRSAAYVEEAKNLGLNGAAPGTMPLLNWAPIDKAMADVGSQVYKTDQHGKVVTKIPTGVVPYQEMADTIAQWKSAQPDSTLNTLEGFDALKRNISDLIDSAGANRQQARLAGIVKDSIVDAISEAHPEYGALMKTYSDASKTLDNIRAQFAPGRSGAAATASAQIGKILRNAGKGANQNLLAQLAAQDPTIPYMLAGNALSSWIPSQAHRIVESPLAVLAYMYQPHFLPGIAATSPRLMGEANLLAGQAAALPQKAGPIVRSVAKQAILAPDRSMATSPDQQATVAPQSRAVRNNNPGNIRDSAFSQNQPGYAGTDGSFARFATPEAGAAAADALLESYGRNGYDTPAAIVSRWSPPYPRGDNDPEVVGRSILRVANALGVSPGQRLDMTDPKVRRVVASAIFRGEAATGGRIQRASGGRARIDHGVEADRLVKMVDHSRKRLAANTQPFLKVPDTTIAKALEVSNRAIGRI